MQKSCLLFAILSSDLYHSYCLASQTAECFSVCTYLALSVIVNELHCLLGFKILVFFCAITVTSCFSNDHQYYVNLIAFILIENHFTVILVRNMVLVL